MKTKIPNKKQAFAYLKKLGVEAPYTGFAYFFCEKACGWVLNPEPHKFAPGVIFVDMKTGAQFAAAGGNPDSGAERLEQLSVAS
jgi:hypothetical protein